MDNWTGLTMQILNGQSEEGHYHSDMELLFVIDGKASLCMGDVKTIMEREDIVVVNSSRMHELNCDEDTIVCQLHYSMKILFDMLENQSVYFDCNSRRDRMRSYGELRSLIRGLVYEYVRQPHKTKCIQKSKMYEILDFLIENYCVDGSEKNVKLSDDLRLQEIFHYVNSNYQANFSLTELAESMYVSPSTLSRFFKKKTGFYFAEYVSNIRLQHALTELSYTDKGITRIAVDAGFSNASVFNKLFKSVYGMTPSEYKNQIRHSVQKKNETREKVRQMLLDKLESTELSGKTIPYFDTMRLKADVSEGKLYKKYWNEAMNIGSAFNLIQANVQKHIEMLHEMLGFKYARLWSVFSGRLMICDGGENHDYNYDMLDSVLDFLVSNNILPFLDLGKRPDTAIGKVNQAIYYTREYIDFCSKKAWEDFLEDFISHILERYGREQVSQWIFEFTCDRTHYDECKYYKDDHYDFSEVFCHAYRLIREKIPGAMVCGPGAISDLDRSFLINLLKELKHKGCVPDMATFLMFPYVPMSVEGKIQYKHAGREDFESEELRKIQNCMAEADLSECPICISEWNCTLMNRNYINDSCFRAAFGVRVIEELIGKVKMLIPWGASDWMSRYYDSMCVANGSAGFLTKDAIVKPIAYAWMFMSMMGNELLDHGENYLITKRGDKDYYILCCNYKWYTAKYLIKDESMLSPDDIKGIFVSEEKMEADILLEGIEDGEYLIKRRRIHPKMNTLLSVWEQFDYERHIAPSEIAYMKECCVPELTMSRQKVTTGCMHLLFDMEAHEVTLMHIYRA